MSVSSQDAFGGNVGRDLDACVALVNGLAPGRSRGLPLAPPTPEQAVEVVAGALRIGHYDERPRRTDIAERARTVASDLHRAFVHFQRGELTPGAQVVDELLERYDVRIRLSNHANRPWHIHYRNDMPDAATVLGAGAAAALALVIDAGDHHRLRVCEADQCDRVLFDRSRNGLRRFCSAACRNRTKTQAFRRRAATRGAASTGVTPPEGGQGLVHPRVR